MKRQSTVVVGLACSVLLAVSACGSSDDSGSASASIKDKQFTIALEQGNFDEIPDWVALEQGFFKDQGLNVKADQIQTGVTGIKALIGGKTDMATAGGTGVVQADASGGTVKFLAALLQTTPYVIATKPNIKDIKELKGKTFAVSEFGSSSDGAARAALKAAGLTPEKDVQILQLGNNSQRLAGVVTGSAAATVLSPDQTGQLETSGLHVIENLAKLNLDTVHLSIAATQSTLDKYPELAAKMRAAIEEALNYIKDPANKDRVLEIAAKYLKSKPTDSNVVSTYQYYQDTKSIQGVYPPGAKMLEAALKNDIAVTAKTDKNAAKLEPKDLVAEGSLLSE